MYLAQPILVGGDPLTSPSILVFLEFVLLAAVLRYSNIQQLVTTPNANLITLVLQKSGNGLRRVRPNPLPFSLCKQASLQTSKLVCSWVPFPL